MDEQLKEKIKNMSPEELRNFQKQQCIFCKIIEGQIPSKKIHQDDKCIAVLDINPANPGHIILLPKEHYMIMPQVPDEILSHMAKVAKALSSACLKSFKCSGTNIFIANGLIAGQKAQHFMIHIIPRTEGDELNFNLPKNQAKISDLQELKKMLLPKINQTFGIEAPPIPQPEEKPKKIKEKKSEKETKKEIKEKQTKPKETKKQRQPAQQPIPQKQQKKEVDLDKISNLFS